MRKGLVGRFFLNLLFLLLLHFCSPPQEKPLVQRKEEPKRMRSSTWSADIQAMVKYAHLYDELHPFIYQLEGGRKNTGGIRAVWKPNEIEENVRKIREKSPKTLLIPTIFRWENGSEYIMEAIGAKDPSGEIRTKHITAILQEIEKYNWDGIDIDYEGMGCDRKEAFEEFLTLLKAELVKKGKILSVAIHPKTLGKEPFELKCEGLKNNFLVDYHESYKGQWTHDYEFLGKIADKVKIMAYELYPRGPGFPGPGPQAPLDWIENILDYAITRIPKDKLYMAIPTYGYDWPLNCDGETKAVYYTYSRRIMRDKNPQKKQTTNMQAVASSYPRSSKTWPQLDPYMYRHVGKTYEDPSLWYSKDGCDHVAFYMNKSSFSTKYQALKKKDIAGFSFWQLVRDNDPDIHVFLEEEIRASRAGE